MSSPRDVSAGAGAEVDGDRSVAPGSTPTRPASGDAATAVPGADAPAPVQFAERESGAVVDLARELVSHDTQNPPGETRSLIDRLEAFFGDLGVRTERVAVARETPNLLATLPGESDRSLLLAGHVDTVPFDASRWEHDPLGELEGDRLYGRGATDMKGAVAAMLTTARAFVETGTIPPVTLAFALVSDEETGGDRGMDAVLEETGLVADGCVVGETTGSVDRPSLAVADRGHCWLTLRAEGAAAHGSRPMLGENAIERLSDATADLAAVLRRWRPTLPADLGPVVTDSVDYYAPKLGAETARDLFRHPTVNLGVLEGGTVVNSVPDAARARVDVRVPPGVAPSEVVSTVRASLEDHAGVSLVETTTCPGSYDRLDHPVAEATASVVGAVADAPVYRRCATGGGDARHLRAAGIPTVEFGFGTDTVHAVDEYTTVGVLARNVRVLAALPYAFRDHLAASASAGPGRGRA